MRTTIYPADHWSLKVDIPYSMGVKQNKLFALCGQADLKGQGEVQNHGDLQTQTANAIQHIKNLVAGLDCKTEDLTKLVVYYVNNNDVDERQYESFIANQLNCSQLPVITFVALNHFFYPGVMVEIDAWGMHQENSDRIYLPSRHSPFSQAIRQDEMIFVGAIAGIDENTGVRNPDDIVAQSHDVLNQLTEVLSHFSATKKDLVKINNWYVGAGTAEAWEESAKVRADYYHEPGPVATGLPVHAIYPQGTTIQTDAWAMLSTDGESIPKQHVWPEGHWDWPIHLPFKHGLKCRDMIFIGGQVSMNPEGEVINKNDMAVQSRVSMDNIGKILDGFGASYSDIFKMNSFYAGTDDPQDLHTNVNIRSSYFNKPGPASTGIPLNSLAYEGMLTEFETVAMIE